MIMTPKTKKYTQINKSIKTYFVEVKKKNI